MAAGVYRAGPSTCIRGTSNQSWVRPWKCRYPARSGSASFCNTGGRTSAGRPGWRLSNGVSDFDPRHAQFKEDVLQQSLLTLGEIAFGFFLDESERINRLARADNVYPGLLAFRTHCTHLDKRGHIKRFDKTFKIHFRRRRCLAGLIDHFVNLLAGRGVFITLRLLLRFGRWLWIFF